MEIERLWNIRFPANLWIISNYPINSACLIDTCKHTKKGNNIKVHRFLEVIFDLKLASWWKERPLQLIPVQKTGGGGGGSSRRGSSLSNASALMLEDASAMRGHAWLAAGIYRPFKKKKKNPPPKKTHLPPLPRPLWELADGSCPSVNIFFLYQRHIFQPLSKGEEGALEGGGLRGEKERELGVNFSPFSPPALICCCCCLLETSGTVYHLAC